MQIPHVDYTFRYRLLSGIWDSPLIGKGTISRSLSKLLIPKPTGELVARTVYGFDLLINPAIDNGVEHSLYYFGTYEKGTLQFIREHLKPGQVFLDIGANIGLMSLFAAQCVGKQGHVYAFEANPETAKILRHNLHINAVKNTDVIEKAIGNANGNIKLYANWQVNRGGATLIKPAEAKESYEVELTRINDFSELRELPIAMVKIDVEGFELDVLKGMSDLLKRESPPMLIVECSADRNNHYDSVYEMVDYIRSINTYSVYKLSNTKERFGKLLEVSSKEELPTHDNIFCIKRP